MTAFKKYYLEVRNRGVAQVVECLLREQEAASSSLATPTSKGRPQTFCCGRFFFCLIFRIMVHVIFLFGVNYG